MTEDGSLAGGVFEFDAGQAVARSGRARQRTGGSEEMPPGEQAFTVALAVAADGHVVISDLDSGFSQLLQVDVAG
jgi:hypothetical protein